jgi:hypothetical protein
VNVGAIGHIAKSTGQCWWTWPAAAARASEDGKKISLTADGVAVPEEESPVFKRRENVTLTTNHPEYSWVNPIQVWAPLTADVLKGEIRIKGYAV